MIWRISLADPTLIQNHETTIRLAALSGILYLARMRFSVSDTSGSYIIRSYDHGEVVINGYRHTNSVIVMPNRIIDNWTPQTFEDLTEDHFHTIYRLEPQLVLLGTGAEQQFPPLSLYAILLNRGVGVEVMNTSAACRTYNILASEGRNVAAALLIT